MSDVPDLSKFTVVTREAAVEALRETVYWRLRYLKWTPWRKHMTVQDVLNQHGVRIFATEVSESAFSNCVILSPKPYDGPTESPFARIAIEALRK
jgi:hypothetical protein